MTMRILFYFSTIAALFIFNNCSDSLETDVSKKTTEDKIIQLSEAAKANIADIEKAQQYTEEMLRLALEINDNRYIGDAYNIMGSISRNKEDYIKALKSFLASAQAFEVADDTLGMAKVYNNIGNIYRDIQKYNKAIIYYQKRLTLNTLLKDKEGMAITNRNMALTYQLMADYEKAKDSYWTSLYIWKTLKNEERMAQLYNDLGIAYNLYLDNNGVENYSVEKSIIYNLYLNSLELNKKINDKKGIGRAFNNIGIALVEKEDYDNALSYFNRSISLKQSINDQEGLGDTYNNLGYLYLIQPGKISEAIDYFKLAEKYSKDKDLKETYEYLIASLEKQGNFAMANKYLKKMDLLNKELLKNRHREELAKVEARYAIEYAGL